MDQQIIVRRSTAPRKNKRLYVILPLLVVLLAVGGVFGVAGYTGWNLTHPARLPITTTPKSISLLAGARDPEVDAVIADAPFADMRSYLDDNLSVWTDLPSFPFNQAFFIIVPLLTGLQPEQVSPLHEIADYKGRPVLLIHGTGDTKIPISNSEQLQKAYPKAQLLRVPGSDHCKSYDDHPALYLKTLDAFLAGIKP